MKFDSLSFNPEVLKGVEAAGYEYCTPIQEQSLPECVAGKDVIAQSQTGSGKTAVFLLTIFTRLMGAEGSAGKEPRALVMVPTRELAAQVADDAAKLGAFTGLKSVAIYGGVEYDKQVGALKTGVDIVVATPGRLIDLYKSKTLSFESIEIFVIDEADRMFDMGFAPDITYIASRLPKKKPRQTMLFSATIDDNVKRLASRYMRPDLVVIEIEPEQVTVNTIDQRVIYVSNEEKVSVLLALLKRPALKRVIIFTNMKSTAETIGWRLASNGIGAKVLTGDVSQEKRNKIIEGMKAGKLNILVATDVAARGLHIEDVTHVINYDLPEDSANYVHRIGRTARAGKSGMAYSLVCETHALNLPEIEKYIERKLESEWIEDSELVKDVSVGERPRRDRPFEKQARGGKHEPRHEKRGDKKEEGRAHRPERKASESEQKPVEGEGTKKARPRSRGGRGRKPVEGQKTEQAPQKQAGRPEAKKRPEDSKERAEGGQRTSRGSRGRGRTQRPRQAGDAVEKPRTHTQQETGHKPHTPAPEQAKHTEHAHHPKEAPKEHKPQEATQPEKKGGLLKKFLNLIKKG